MGFVKLSTTFDSMFFQCTKMSMLWYLWGSASWWLSYANMDTVL